MDIYLMLLGIMPYFRHLRSLSWLQNRGLGVGVVCFVVVGVFLKLKIAWSRTSVHIAKATLNVFKKRVLVALSFLFPEVIKLINIIFIMKYR